MSLIKELMHAYKAKKVDRQYRKEHEFDRYKLDQKNDINIDFGDVIYIDPPGKPILTVMHSYLTDSFYKHGWVHVLKPHLEEHIKKNVESKKEKA